MASPASLASLGSARPNISSTFDAGPSNGVLPRYQVSRVSFNISTRPIRWSHTCNCVATTGVIEENVIKVSSDSNLRETNNPTSTSSSSTSTTSSNNTGTNTGDLVLKPAPKPTLLRPKAPTIIPPPPRKPPTIVDKEKISVALDEALDKAAKLKMKQPVEPANNEVRSSPQTNPAPKPITRQSSTNSRAPNPDAFKSVWKKGETTAPVVQQEAKVVSKIITRAEIEKRQMEKREIEQQAKQSTLTETQKPQTTARLQSRPSIAPPPVRKPVIVPKPTIIVPKPNIPTQKSDVSAQKSEAVPVPVRKGPILVDRNKVNRPVTAPRDREEKEDDEKDGEPRSVTASPKRGTQQFKRGKSDQNRISKPIRRYKKSADDENRNFKQGAPASRGVRRRRRMARRTHGNDYEEEQERAEIIEVGKEGMPMEDLAEDLAVPEHEIYQFLYAKGIPLDGASILDRDVVAMVCEEYGVEVLDSDVRVEEMAKKNEMLDEDDLELLETRPPVITIMGHVDHGKTTLLDYIRKSKVVASEAGGITQGIGAYKVQVPVDGQLQSCVFLDTPGHEAFGAMRARGAKVTDITIIVVAADDGVQPQTQEAIAHAKAAKVPIVIAINKIDREGASPEKVMQELSNFGIVPEAWGGEIPMVPISALKGENIDELLETVMLVAEMQELKANPNRNAKGTVIEAGLDKARGPVVSLIVQNGTLKTGDVVVCGEAFGKIRAMFDDRRNRVDEAKPSFAVQVIGLNNVPVAGDEFEVVNSLDTAKTRADETAMNLRTERIASKTGETKATLATLAAVRLSRNHAGLDRHQLNIILKVDVQGSIEAIRHVVDGLPQENVHLKFIMQAAGDVTISDVDMASAGEAVIYGFNVKVPGSIKSYAEKNNVEIRLYRVIYDMIDGLRKTMEDQLDLGEEQIPIGLAEVQAVFSRGSGKVAGCMVSEGKVTKGCDVNIIRNGKKILTSIVTSLRRVKEDVKEIGTGLECGIGVDGFDDWAEGDVIEAFSRLKKQRTLEEASATVEAALVEAGYRG